MTERHRFRICGITMETDWPLQTPLLSSTAEPDLRFVVASEAPGGAWVLRRELRIPDGTVAMVLGTANGVDVIGFPDIGDAWLVADDEIVFHLRRPEHWFQVEVVLLGTLLADWLDRHNRIAMHGSAATDGERAVGFLGPNGAGKTTLAVELVKRGWRLMADDLLTVQAVGGGTGIALVAPAAPQVRMSPDDARRFLGTTDGLERAHPHYDKLRIRLGDGQYAVDPVPLGALYLPRNSPAASVAKIEPVAPQNALFHLLFNTFARQLRDTPSQRESWVTALGNLVNVVPMYRLSYPDSLDALPAVAAAVVAHAATTAI